jgi:4-hydroxy-tetrahydrodipicolinate reductase
MQLVGGIVSEAGGHAGREIAPGVVAFGADDIAKVLEGADVYLDATSASAAEKNLLKVPGLGVNCVVATTGLPEDLLRQFEAQVAENNVSAIVSPNFSVGVNVFWKMCGVLAAVLEDYDVEIIETHHDKK